MYVHIYSIYNINLYFNTINTSNYSFYRAIIDKLMESSFDQSSCLVEESLLLMSGS